MANNNNSDRQDELDMGQMRSVQVFKGRVEQATYRKPELPKFIGNPTIEALPPISNRQQVLDMMTRIPARPEDADELEPEVRTHAAMDVLHFFQPLPIHLRLEGMISRMLRDGYLARNPADPRFYGTLLERLTAFRAKGLPTAPPSLSAAGFAMLGMSGMGKSVSTREILQSYPQIILHSEYNERKFTRTQVVWLVLECPKDGTTVGLCKSFFHSMGDILGQDYIERYAKKGQTETDLILSMAWLAGIHHLGLLVIDETQDLSEAKSGGAKRLISFLVRLINTMGLPVMLIATTKLWKLLTSEFRLGRRMSGQGGVIIERLKFDAHWDAFATALWDIQYVKHRCDLTSELSSTLHELSYGVPDLANRIFLTTQVRAIETGVERITIDLLRSSYRDDFRVMDRIREVLESEYAPESERICDADLPPARGTGKTHKEAGINKSKPRKGKSRAGKRKESPNVVYDREDDMRGIIARGVAASPQKSAYEALLDAGHVAPAAEFFTKNDLTRTEGGGYRS
jgi:hypothetical protein